MMSELKELNIRNFRHSYILVIWYILRFLILIRFQNYISKNNIKITLFVVLHVKPLTVKILSVLVCIMWTDITKIMTNKSIRDYCLLMKNMKLFLKESNNLLVKNAIFVYYYSYMKIKINKKTLCVVTIAMICSNLASLWKFQNFGKPIYNPDEHLWYMLQK